MIALFFFILFCLFVWLYVKASTAKDIAEMEAEFNKHGLEFWRQSYIDLVNKMQ
jgi:hypothetical protein